MTIVIYYGVGLLLSPSGPKFGFTSNHNDFLCAVSETDIALELAPGSEFPLSSIDDMFSTRT